MSPSPDFTHPRYNVRQRSASSIRIPQLKSVNENEGEGSNHLEQSQTIHEVARENLTGKSSTETRKVLDYIRGLTEFGSEIIENKGAVARDHMANERTFLSWMRTSLGLATAGVGVTQLFKLAEQENASTNEFLIKAGKPIGATFIGIAIYCILMGLYRFFNTQAHLKNDEYPAARFSVGFLVLFMLSMSILTLVSVLYSKK